MACSIVFNNLEYARSSKRCPFGSSWTQLGRKCVTPFRVRLFESVLETVFAMRVSCRVTGNLPQSVMEGLPTTR